ncbi:vWA domain-containing protein [Acinetobacter sp. CFCC 10889]|uniref:vWA domain-containing protein n=1 Tax=Acinetobacter sp. CFCC 10889 TaxID=1775557 RepID=UPI001D182EE4|nr:hypothetical protein [Acinetobacter sp. CFCC 10889]
MLIQKQLLALLVGSSMLLTACGGDSNDSESTTPKPTEPKPTEPKPTEPKPTEPKPTEVTVQTEATLISEKANIAVFGKVDKKNFSETSLSTGNGVLLLDDAQLNSVGFALDLKEKATDLSVFSAAQLNNYMKLLKDNGAIVNVLVNKTSQNPQGNVVNVTLDVDFKNAENLNRVREILLLSLNQGKSIALPTTVTAKDTKQRLNLAFWVANGTGFVWGNTYAASQAGTIEKQYGDLNIASALTSNVKLEIKTVTNSFTQNAKGSNAVDILWNIDSSGSMSEEQKNLANGASQFFTALNKAGVDYRLAVNTQDGGECKSLRTLSDKKSVFIDRTTANAEEEWKKLAQPGTWDSATETGFYCVREADLTSFDRPNAKNLVVFVSDEPENETVQQTRPSGASGYKVRNFTDYKNYFLKTGATYFSIVGTADVIRNTFEDNNLSYQDKNWDCKGEGGSAAGGAHFKEISRVTGGSFASICSNASSWGVMFNEIIKSASGLASSFTLTQLPIPSTVTVKVAGKEIQRDLAHQNGFDLVYSATDVTVVFYGAALPTANQKVDVSYKYLKK